MEKGGGLPSEPWGRGQSLTPVRGSQRGRQSQKHASRRLYHPATRLWISTQDHDNASGHASAIWQSLHFLCAVRFLEAEASCESARSLARSPDNPYFLVCVNSSFLLWQAHPGVAVVTGFLNPSQTFGTHLLGGEGSLRPKVATRIQDGMKSGPH